MKNLIYAVLGTFLFLGPLHAIEDQRGQIVPEYCGANTAPAGTEAGDVITKVCVSRVGLSDIKVSGEEIRLVIITYAEGAQDILPILAKVPDWLEGDEVKKENLALFSGQSGVHPQLKLEFLAPLLIQHSFPGTKPASDTTVDGLLVGKGLRGTAFNVQLEVISTIAGQ